MSASLAEKATIANSVGIVMNLRHTRAVPSAKEQARGKYIPQTTTARHSRKAQPVPFVAEQDLFLIVVPTKIFASLAEKATIANNAGSGMNQRHMNAVPSAEVQGEDRLE